MINFDKYNGTHDPKSLSTCPICGNKVHEGQLFCEICGMRIHSNQRTKTVEKVNTQNRLHSTYADMSQPSEKVCGMRSLSEMPDLKVLIETCKSSYNLICSGMSNVVDEFRRKTLDDISDIIEIDERDIEIFESLGTQYIEERDFGLDKCTQAAKEIFNLGVMMSWANLSIQQKMDISGVYAIKVAEAFELKIYNGICFENLGEGTLGYNTGDGWIHLSDALLDPRSSAFEIIDTITHESRHQYQSESISGYHNVPEDVVREWAIADQIYHNNAAPCCYDPWGYQYSTIEIDARYAAETVIRNITHDLFNAKSAERKNVIDHQELRRRLIKEEYPESLLEQTTDNLLRLDGKAAEMLRSWLEYGTVPEFNDINGVSSAYLREHLKMKDPAIILSYGMLIDNPSRNSKFLKNMPNPEFRNRAASKANLRSMYIFYNERDYENVKNIIYYGNRAVYDKLNWYGDWRNINGHDIVWRVDLNDDLTQEELDYVVGHIREHQGIYYRE